ncbi:MAG: PorP/SprF family type IX secretion system membrane protein [Crocinitomicaceae bacterium]|nr:PorP/SprF family type IX secretion system membrane protein [Crocinitomicaceae bacterium]
MSLLFFVSFVLGAQQVPDFRTELYSPQWHNPASFGTWNKYSINLLGAYGAISPGFGSGAFMVNGEAFVELPNKTSGIGVGCNYLYTALQDIDETKGLNLQLNYQLEFDKFNISIGAAPGFQKVTYKEFDWIATDTTNDPNLPGPGTQTKLTIDAGFFFYSDRYYAGLSAGQINEPDYDSLNFRAGRRLYFDSGYRFKVSRNLQLFSSLSISHDGATFRKAAVTLMLQLMKPGITFGGGYSFGSSFWALVGYEYKRFSFIYTLGYRPFVLSSGSNLSHETRLTYKLKKKPNCSTCEHF